MIIVICLLVLLLVISITINVFVVKALRINYNKVIAYEKWIYEWHEYVGKSYEHLKYIDDKHIFEKDDEVGFVFTDILNLVEDLNSKVQIQEKSVDKDSV